jgi:hypothetical protein
VEDLLFQSLNVYNASDVRQVEIHTTEPLIPSPSHLEVEIINANLEKYTSLGSNQFLTEFIQEESEILLSGIHKQRNKQTPCLLVRK